MQLDRVAKEIVLRNLREAIPSQRPAMVRELRALAEAEAANGGRPITLPLFLQETGLDLVGLQERQLVRAEAGGRNGDAICGPKGRHSQQGLHRLLHIDDPLRLDAYRHWLQQKPADSRLLTALLHTPWTSDKPASLAEAAVQMQAHPAIAAELAELVDILEARADHLTVPLQLDKPKGSSHRYHCRYMRAIRSSRSSRRLA